MKQGKDRLKGEGAEVIALLGLVFVVLFALIWFLASHRIVYSSAPWLQWMAWPYVLWDPEQARSLGEAAQVYRQRPRDIAEVPSCRTRSRKAFCFSCFAYLRDSATVR